MKTLTILSWNVNGLRAAVKKGLLGWLHKQSPDILCLQETKARFEQLPTEAATPEGYHAFFNAADRPGYSGVAIYSKQKPSQVRREPVGVPSGEGRWIEVDFGDWTLINIYFPNGKNGVQRLAYKMEFYEQALKYFSRLIKSGRHPVICGDVNTAHKPIDLTHPKANETVSGFLPQERDWMDRLSKRGFLDAFRLFHPEPQCYTWWDLRTGARARNVGWRLDYFFAAEGLRGRLEDAFHLTDVMGSDHCPVGVRLKG